jgi:hypothetical protein
MPAEPARIWSAAIITAFMPEPHILLTVVAGTLMRDAARSDGGLPGRRLAEASRQHATEDHLVDRVDGRRLHPQCAALCRYGPELRRADGDERCPGRLPIGVRRAERITIFSCMAGFSSEL